MFLYVCERDCKAGANVCMGGIISVCKCKLDVCVREYRGMSECGRKSCDALTLPPEQGWGLSCGGARLVRTVTQGFATHCRQGGLHTSMPSSAVVCQVLVCDGGEGQVAGVAGPMDG